jgi:hypothetical protein
MTGAGAATFAFDAESSFLGTVAGSPQAFGRNTRLTELDLSNQLQRMRDAGQVEAAESIAGNFEGAVGVTSVVSADTHDGVESDIVFNGSGAFTTGAANSVTIYAGIDYLGGTTERELQGAIPISYSVTGQQGGPIEYDLTMAYAEEVPNTAITPSGISQASPNSTAQFHSADLTINTTSITKLQEFELGAESIARFHRGTSRTPVDAVGAAPETSLSTTAIFEGPTYLEHALGDSGATGVEDSVSAQTGQLELATAGGTTITTYDLPRLAPANYSWDSLIDEADLTDPVDWHVNGGLEVV